MSEFARRRSAEVGSEPSKSPSPNSPHQAPTSPFAIMRVTLGNLGRGLRLAFADGRFERFADTHWAPISENGIMRLILGAIASEGSSPPTRKLIREATSLLEIETAVPSALQYPEHPRPVINCKNSELWILPDGSIRLQSHDPESRQRYCLDIDYDPAATCPVFDQAIAGIFARSSGPETVGRCWDEIVGAVIHPARQLPLIVVCRGGGGDGKTLLVRLAMQLLHPSVVSAMPVEDLTGSRFALGDLAGRLLFVDMDMAAEVKLPDGMLKRMSEGTLTTAERKNRDPVTFTLRSMPLLIGNNVPRLTDRSQGFKRRLCVMPFDRSFLPEEQDSLLFQRIAETEMSGVLNRALAGLQRLIRRGWKLDLPGDVRQATEAWWAEATGQALASASRARGSRAPEPEAEFAGDVLSSRPTPAASPERSTVGREKASPMPVKVTVDLDTTAEQQRVEVITAPQSVTVRVGRPT